MNKEQWLQIPGYKLYQVSDRGLVKSFCQKKPRILKPGKHRDGYLYVVLSQKNKRVSQYNHRLVMRAFKGDSKLQVNHINGIKTDNRLVNLEYCTISENVSHAYKTGLHTQEGEKNGRARLTSSSVKKIKKMINSGMSLAGIGRRFQVNGQTIGDIKKGRTWGHI